MSKNTGPVVLMAFFRMAVFAATSLEAAIFN